MVVAGSPADYDEWGEGWSYPGLLPTSSVRPPSSGRHGRTRIGPHASSRLPRRRRGRRLPAPPIRTTRHAGRRRAVPGERRRWTPLERSVRLPRPARDRPNLSIVGETLVDRVVLDRSRATVSSPGRRPYRGGDRPARRRRVLLAAILAHRRRARTGLRRLGIPIVESLPVGERLLDHCGTDVAWDLAPLLQAETDVEAWSGPLRGPCVREGGEHGLRARELGPPPPPLDLRHGLQGIGRASSRST